MIGELFDSLIGVFSPVRQLQRKFARSQMNRLHASTSGRHRSMEEALGTGSGYDAAAKSRLNRSVSVVDENAISRGDIRALRAASWNLFRNNPHARKICRQLESKVIGRGMQPYPLAAMKDGEPNLEWRARARQLWRDVSCQLDSRGRPGRGGQSLVSLQKTALKAVVLGGEVFVRLRRLTSRRQAELGLLLPLQVQLLHADRLDDTKNDDGYYHGIEFNKAGDRSYYHFLGDNDSVRIRSRDVIHLYVADDIDQMRGTPWYAAALTKMRDVGDYEYSELQAAAMSACVVLGYRRSSGQSSFGLTGPDANWDLTDTDGNKLTNFSPGMIIDLGQNGELQSFNPLRPNADAPEFIGHMVRTEAAAVPGVKPSSLTGDYRGASFSSEKSADNDAWPELEGVQDWLAETLCQPLYEEVVDAAVEAGYFDGVAGFSVKDYTIRRQEYLRSEWRGPVARSINPSDDAEAGMLRMRSLTSSPQREGALVGVSLQDILEEWEDLRNQLNDRGLPADELIKQLLGIVAPQAEPAQKTDASSQDDKSKDKEGDESGNKSEG